MRASIVEAGSGVDMVSARIVPVQQVTAFKTQLDGLIAPAAGDEKTKSPSVSHAPPEMRGAAALPSDNIQISLPVSSSLYLRYRSAVTPPPATGTRQL